VLYHVFVNVTHAGWTQKYMAIPAAALPFATGAAIFHYRREALAILRRFTHAFDPGFPSILFALVLLNWYAGYLLNDARGIWFYSNYALNALLVLVLCERKTLPFVSPSFDRWMGDFSYPIYLIHYQVGLLVVVSFGSFGLALERPDAWLMVISLPFIFLVSWALTKAVERPIELVRGRVKGRGGDS
jgi:peptidoglycan/LPS O-acetylase OafA/YrhL